MFEELPEDFSIKHSESIVSRLLNGKFESIARPFIFNLFTYKGTSLPNDFKIGKYTYILDFEGRYFCSVYKKENKEKSYNYCILELRFNDLIIMTKDTRKSKISEVSYHDLDYINDYININNYMIQALIEYAEETKIKLETGIDKIEAYNEVFNLWYF